MQSRKTCPHDEANAVPCAGPGPESELVTVSAGEPVECSFCSRCFDCWSGVRVEDGRAYVIEVVGLDGWRDASLVYMRSQPDL